MRGYSIVCIEANLIMRRRLEGVTDRQTATRFTNKVAVAAKTES